MKILKCSDLKPEGNCDFEATGETNQEVIDKAFKHAKEDKQTMITQMNEILDKQ